MSLARLAAEAAFAPPAAVVAAAPQPRFAEPSRRFGADSRPAPEAARSNATADARPPRVFRLASVDGAAPTAAGAPTHLGDNAPAAVSEAPESSVARRAARKRSADRRPGPGRVVYAAPLSEAQAPRQVPRRPETEAEAGERILDALDAALNSSGVGDYQRVAHRLDALKRYLSSTAAPRGF